MDEECVFGPLENGSWGADVVVEIENLFVGVRQLVSSGMYDEGGRKESETWRARKRRSRQEC